MVAEVITLLRHDAEIYRYHVGLPEYSYLTIRKLRAFGKKTKINKWRDLCRALSSQLEDHSTFAKKNRITLGKSPMQITDFEPLLPSGAPPAGARLMKLLAGRGAASAAPQEVIVGHDYHTGATATDKRQKKQVVEEEEDEVEEVQSDEDSEGDDVMQEDTVEQRAGKQGNMDDKVGDLDWSDDDM